MDVGGGLYVTLGRLLRARRESVGLSQGELARRVGMTRTSITNIESGRQKVQLHTLYDVARALDVPPEVLLPAPENLEPKAIEDRLPQGLTPEERDWAMRLLVKDPG
jgi:transcriptional regulator with XRE-family HTH domain